MSGINKKREVPIGETLLLYFLVKILMYTLSELWPLIYARESTFLPCGTRAGAGSYTATVDLL
jgi:hypothetical protein